MTDLTRTAEKANIDPASFLHRVRGNLFSIDLRALAAFRIGIAFILLCDLVARLPDVAVFYTDAGVYPRAIAIPRLVAWATSIHFISGGVAFQAALLILHALCAVALMLGWRTRWMTILSWFLLSSLHYRNPKILFGADKYLLILLFWGIFLPLGAKWSLDSWKDPTRKERPTRLCTWGTAAVLIQNALVYLVTGLLKWPQPTWKEGTALFYSLSASQSVKEFGAALTQFPDLLHVYTTATLYLEILGPLLLFSPLFTTVIRFWILGILMLLNFGIFLILKLWIFPWVNITALLVFFPSEFWDWLEDRARAILRAPVLLQTASILKSRLPHDGTMLQNFLPRRPVQIKESRLSGLCVLVALVGVIYWNMTVVAPSHFKMPWQLYKYYFLLNIDQNWMMFTNPEKFGSGWKVAAGTLKDGRQVNLFDRGSDVNAAMPRNAKNFRNIRWILYLILMNWDNSDSDMTLRKRFVQYLCQSWNSTHEDQQKLVSIEIFSMYRKVIPDSQEQAPYQRYTSFQGECTDTKEANN